MKTTTSHPANRFRRFSTAWGQPGIPTWHTFMVLLVSALVLGGCASTTTLTSAGQAAITPDDDKAIVLIRVDSRLDGQEWKPFSTIMKDGNVSMGLGSFESGGEPEDVGTLHFLSDELRSQGWTYLLLGPGSYYLSIYPPRSQIDDRVAKNIIDETPVWRIDVPNNAKLIYAGTVHLSGETTTRFFTLKMWRHVITTASIQNDLEPAEKLLAEYFPGWGEVQVMPMQRHSGAFMLYAPFPASAK